jgi:hypothetical protein
MIYDRKKICLASIHTSDMEPLAQLTWHKNKKLYCDLKGYSAVLKEQNTPYSGFDKILFLDALVNENKYDWILWCDCDTLITNFNKNIEDLFDENYHFFLTTDVNGINGGVFLFRTTQQGLSYFNHIKEKMHELAHQNQYRFGEEQNAMMKTYQDSEFKNIIKTLPQKSMNSYDYDLYKYDRTSSIDKLGTQGHWEKGDFIIHIPGFGPDRFDERMGHFNHFINEVIQ